MITCASSSLAWACAVPARVSPAGWAYCPATWVSFWLDAALVSKNAVCSCSWPVTVAPAVCTRLGDPAGHRAGRTGGQHEHDVLAGQHVVQHRRGVGERELVLAADLAL